MAGKKSLSLPLVSIIIPFFNRSGLLTQTIDSVRSQTFADWEIIIVDDGSTEEELKAIERFQDDPRIKLSKREHGAKGPSACRNKGVQNAKGQFLIFLDSDDLLAPHCLEQRVRVMQTFPEPDMAVFLIENFNKVPGDNKTIFNRDITKENLADHFLLNENPWQTMAPVWRRSYFQKTGGFDEDLLFMEDPELHIRAVTQISSDLQICYDLPPDCYYRINHMDDTKKDFYRNSIFYRILFYKKIFEKHPSHFIEQHQHSIRKGILNLLKNFLYARAAQFPELMDMFVSLMRSSKLFSNAEIRQVMFLTQTGNNSSWLMRKLRFRGICFRLLPQ